MTQSALALTLVVLAFLLKGSDSLPTGQLQDSNGERGNPDPYRKMQPMIARACNMASLDVYKEIAPDHANMVMSPFSMCSLLAVCINGARGKTQNEMKAKLILKLTNKMELSKIYASIYKSFTADEHVNITTSNVLLFNKNLQLVKETEDDYRKSFNGSVQPFDPEMKELTSSYMNSLLSSATDGLIEGELKADDISAESALYLSNTLTLSARWKDEFKIEETNPMWFYLNVTSRVLADTMTRRGKYRTIKNNNMKCDIVEIPYKGERFAMYILLPFQKDGLKGMEAKLTNKRRLKMETVFYEIETVEAQTIDLYLPKFSISSSFSMKGALKANKIRTLFDDKKADLSGLVHGGNVFIRDAIQKSTIAVEEKGTVAGTHSLMEGQFFSAVPTFHADHPFMYVLRDRQTDFNIFIGKYSKP